MEVLRFVRNRSGRLIRAPGLLALVAVCAAVACEPVETELAPDQMLVDELGLSPSDRVHTVGLVTGVGERAEPDSIEVRPGDFLQFVSDDWFVHEVHFDTAAVPPEARRFLDRTGQLASPPLLQRGARFVLSFEDAPMGRYPFRLEGNRGPGSGVIVVAPPPAMP